VRFPREVTIIAIDFYLKKWYNLQSETIEKPAKKGEKMNKFENVLSVVALTIGALCLMVGLTFFAGTFVLAGAAFVSALVSSSEAWVALPLLAFLCLGGYVVYDLAEALDIVSGVKHAWSRNRPDMFRLRLQLSAWGWSTSPKERNSFRDLQSILKATSLLSHGKNVETNASKLFGEWNVRKNNTSKDELEAWLGRNVANLASAKDQNLGCETFEDAFERAQAHVNAH